MRASAQSSQSRAPLAGESRSAAENQESSRARSRLQHGLRRGTNILRLVFRKPYKPVQQLSIQRPGRRRLQPPIFLLPFVASFRRCHWCPANAFVQLQARYNHCGEAASEECLSAATFVRRQRRGEVVLHFQNCHHPLRAAKSSSRRIISSLAAHCSTNDWRSDAASRNSFVSKS